MRIATTMAEVEGKPGKWICLADPSTPIQVQKDGLKQLMLTNGETKVGGKKMKFSRAFVFFNRTAKRARFKSEAELKAKATKAEGAEPAGEAKAED